MSSFRSQEARYDRGCGERTEGQRGSPASVLLIGDAPDLLTKAPEGARAYVSGEFMKVRARLRNYALSLTRDRDRADDLLQDVFIRAVDHAEQFERGTNFSAWIFRLTRNHYLDGLRRKKNQPHENVDDLRIAKPASQENAMRTRELVRYLKLLPRDIRRILLLSGLNDSSYEEIAEMTGYSIGTIKSKISRARDLLDGAL